MDKAPLVIFSKWDCPIIGTVDCPLDDATKLKTGTDCYDCVSTKQRDSDHAYYQAEIDRVQAELTRALDAVFREAKRAEKAEAELAELKRREGLLYLALQATLVKARVIASDVASSTPELIMAAEKYTHVAFRV